MRKPSAVDVELYQSAKALFKDGCLDISAEELAEAYYGSDKLTFPEMIDGVASRLRKIASLLEEDGLNVVLVARCYFMKRKPRTRDEARKCLTLGTGKKARGIHVVTESGDLLLHQSLTLNNRQTAGATERAMRQIVMARNKDLLSEGEAMLMAEQRLKEISDPQKKSGLLKLFEQVGLKLTDGSRVFEMNG